jgi:tetratricopeptide (TPR) repeat protein
VLVLIGLLSVPPFSRRDRDRLRANSCILFGTSFRRGGESLRAEEMFEAATRLDPSSAEAFFDLGHILQGRLDHARDEGMDLDEAERDRLFAGALSAYGSAREVDPSHFKAALNQAILVLKERLGPEGNDPSLLDLATRAAGRAVELRPLDARACLTLGILLGLQGDAEGALAHYRRAYELDPTNVSVRERIRALEKR